MPIAQYGPTWKVFFFSIHAQGHGKSQTACENWGKCVHLQRDWCQIKMYHLCWISGIGKVKAVLAQIRQAVNDLGS